MYVWIWRTLPGGTPGKIVGSVLLALAVVTVLFLWVFPWIDDNFALLSDVTIDQAESSSLNGAAGPSPGPAVTPND